MMKYGLVGLLFLAISLGGVSAVLNHRLDNANEENQKLSKANKDLNKVVSDRDETINALKGAADADRRATEQQLKIEQQKRAKADAENRTLRDALEHSGCNNQRLPDDALRILRREG